jgi:large subunit ribosomal protein L12e
VKLTVQNRQATIELVPSSATLIIKGLKEPPRDRKKDKEAKRKTFHHGNLSLDQIFDIARTIRQRSLAKDFSGTVREVLGTCSSMGCSIDGMNPHELSQKIIDGEVECPAK